MQVGVRSGSIISLVRDVGYSCSFFLSVIVNVLVVGSSVNTRKFPDAGYAPRLTMSPLLSRCPEPTS